MLNLPHRTPSKDNNLESGTHKHLPACALTDLDKRSLPILLVALLALDLRNPVIRLPEGHLDPREVLCLGEVLVVHRSNAAPDVQRQPVHVRAREPRRAVGRHADLVLAAARRGVGVDARDEGGGHAGHDGALGVDDPDLEPCRSVGGHGDAGERGEVEGHLDGRLCRHLLEETFHAAGCNVEHWRIPARGVEGYECDNRSHKFDVVCHYAILDFFKYLSSLFVVFLVERRSLFVCVLLLFCCFFPFLIITLLFFSTLYGLFFLLLLLICE